jgi:poly(ADP-ribose) glycohydrolase ARH3
LRSSAEIDPGGEGVRLILATARSLVQCGDLRVDHSSACLAPELADAPSRTLVSSVAALEDAEPEHADSLRSWQDLHAAGESFGSGAAVRIVPVALLHFRDSTRAAQAARAAASVTHAHPIGEDGAALQAAALAEIVAHPERDPSTLPSRLLEHVRTRWFRERVRDLDRLASASPEILVKRFGTGVEAHRSVPTAVCCFLRHPDAFDEAVRFALSVGGDADRIASMTGALVGARVGARAIPAACTARLEAHASIVDLADRLLELAVAREIG